MLTVVLALILPQSDAAPAPQRPEAGADTLLRGVLDSPGGDLPFAIAQKGGRPRAIRNAQEEIVLGEMRVDGAKWVFPLPPYDSELEMAWLPARGKRGEMASGLWRRRSITTTQRLPLRVEPWPFGPAAREGDERRPAPMFDLPGEPLDLTGRWSVRFEHDDDPAVAEFGPAAGVSAGVPGELAGTFLTTTGDYRYLAGTARGDQLRLSCFDGAHAFLFHATLQPDGTLRGDFWSGPQWHETWSAQRDEDARLPDAFTLTEARPEFDLLTMRFPDQDGVQQRLGDLFGRATLLVLMGTWCPNCGDAGVTLRQLERRYGERGLRVVMLAFENSIDLARNADRVRAYRRARGIDWPILIAGLSLKQQASGAFPAVDRVRAYPTILFVDHGGEIAAVYQGFCGPATGDAFVDQQRQFEAIVERLLAEAEGKR